MKHKYVKPNAVVISISLDEHIAAGSGTSDKTHSLFKRSNTCYPQVLNVDYGSGCIESAEQTGAWHGPNG